MSDPRDDFVFDLFLEEALSGVQPPDVSQRVLSALAARAGASPAAGASAPPSLRPISLTAEGVRAQGSGGSDSRVAPALGLGKPPLPAKLRSRLPTLVSLALAASLLVAAGVVWRVAHHKSPQLAQQGASGELGLVEGRDQPRKIREQPPALDNSATRDPVAQNAVAPNPLARAANNSSLDRRSADRPADNRPADDVAQDAASFAAVESDSPNSPSADERQSPPSVLPDSSDFDHNDRQIAGASPAAGLSSSAVSDADVVAYINHTIRVHAADAGLRFSPRATDAEWCRRVHLDLIGRIPTLDELESFLVDNARNKRARLVGRLLGDEASAPRRRAKHQDDVPADRYLESYARFWTVLWTNLLIGRNGGMEPGSPVNRAALEQYLRRSFLTNKPYRQLAYELVAARGSNLPGEDDYNGAVNFLLAHVQDKATAATAKTAQVFLGMQVQCTQCHNHPFNDWKQNRFWELNAFFRQARETREMHGGDLRLVRLVDEDFAGESGNDPDEAEIYYEQRNGILLAAYPTFVDGTAVGRDGRVSQVDRRRELARMIARSDQLSLAMVNRLWAHFLGYGFAKPVDDLGPHNPPSHPELLERLGREFAATGYDLKRLMRWIVLSEPYSLSSKFGPKQGNAADDPSQGRPPLFTHFYVRQMLAEQLYDSLLVATGAHLTEGNYEEQQRIKDDWLRQFAIAFGTDENDEATTFDGTITQTLVMMNGELTRRATSGESGSFLYDLAQTGGRKASEPKGYLNQLYRAALARSPSKHEIQLVGGFLDARDDDSAAVLQDVWWALLNSNEFILNH